MIVAITTGTMTKIGNSAAARHQRSNVMAPYTWSNRYATNGPQKRMGTSSAKASITSLQMQAFSSAVWHTLTTGSGINDPRRLLAECLVEVSHAEPDECRGRDPVALG